MFDLGLYIHKLLPTEQKFVLNQGWKWTLLLGPLNSVAPGFPVS